jgi:MerR family transcriptional regulator, thiopeptide resistance regulator
MEKLYRVHQFAKLAGVTVKALRHYDRLGLLTPARSEAGYRLYQLGDLARLQQIIALKSVGLPLRHIRTLLDRDPLPLVATFRQQREVLEDRRRLLDRAIEALTQAETALLSGASSTTAVLREVIRIMEMQDVDVMKKYFSDEAWEEWRHHYEDWPPEEWRTLYRDIIAAIDSDPTSAIAQALVDRWLSVVQGASPQAAIRTGLIKAWADREHWPAFLKRRVAEYDIERATRFIGEALWERWEADRLERERAGAPAPPRVSESQRRLFRDWSTILGSDPLSQEARALVARWRALLEAETGGDEEMTRDVLDAFSRRRQWPDGMKRYVASLYEVDVDTWQRVTDFIERAAAAPLP